MFLVSVTLMLYSTRSFSVLMIIVIYVFLSVEIQKRFRQKQKKSNSKIFKSESKVKGMCHDSLNGCKVIRAYNQEDFIAIQFNKILENERIQVCQKSGLKFELNIKLSFLSAFVMTPSIYFFVIIFQILNFFQKQNFLK